MPRYSAHTGRLLASFPTKRPLPQFMDGKLNQYPFPPDVISLSIEYSYSSTS